MHADICKKRNPRFIVEKLQKLDINCMLVKEKRNSGKKDSDERWNGRKTTDWMKVEKNRRNMRKKVKI